MPLKLTPLVGRVTPANAVPAGEFNWPKATPAGGLAALVWEGTKLTCRTWAGWDEELGVSGSNYP